MVEEVILALIEPEQGTKEMRPGPVSLMEEEWHMSSGLTVGYKEDGHR
jgi:hypothetical protein